MKKILITGGAGFIGTNAVHYFAKKGWNVCLLDNLSRKGSEENLIWLESQKDYSFIFKKIWKNFSQYINIKEFIKKKIVDKK